MSAETQDKQTTAIMEVQTERSIEAVKTQIQKIQQLMKSVMREGEHFGTIPGTDKPTLYKAGAEKLGFTFRLVPYYAPSRQELPDGHREYEVICTLRHMETGQVVGQGVGNCSTMESKYRYRYSDESTGNPVPRGYWDLRKENPKEAQQLIGGPGFKTRKVNGSWIIVRQGERIENPDIADCYNTVLKMAKKRAHVDAMITACAASDIFAQDLEDFRDDDGRETEDETTKVGNEGWKKGDEKQEQPEEFTAEQWRAALFDGLKKMIKNGHINDTEHGEWRKRVFACEDDIGGLQKVYADLKALHDQRVKDAALGITPKKDEG